MGISRFRVETARPCGVHVHHYRAKENPRALDTPQSHRNRLRTRRDSRSAIELGRRMSLGSPLGDEKQGMGATRFRVETTRSTCAALPHTNLKECAAIHKPC
jgi:hypothetical protein